MTRAPYPGAPAGSASRDEPALERHLLAPELAKRWRLTTRTLQRWRRAGTGPVFLRLGHRVAYRLSDVERFEEAQSHSGGQP
jgi:hypothetical protein